jgi:hypothetical protein
MNKFRLWFEIICIVVAFALGACVCFADYVITKPQPLARSLTEAQLEAVVDKVPANASVTLPAHLVASKKTDIQTNVMLEEFKAIIADTRKNIPECKNMSDFEIAALYIQQMTKKATDIKVGATNTIERIIGAGMREDISK